LAKDRLIAEVETPAEAKKVEETVKTGYLESTIDTLINWIGVEDDLVSSYDALASKAQSTEAKAAYKRLADESRKNIEALAVMQRSLETLDKARVQRLKLLAAIGS